MSQNSHFSDQELDTLFKEAAAQGTAPAFDDAYWAEMEALLPAKKRRGIIFWSTVGAIPIILGIIGLSLFGWNNDRTIAAQQKTVSGQKRTAQTDIQTNNTPDNVSVPATGTTPAVNKISKTKTNNVIHTTYKPTKTVEVKPGILVSDAVSDPAVSENATALSYDYSFRHKALNFTYPVTLNAVDPDRKTGRFLPVYVDFALGYGQSYRQMELESNWMSQFKIGAGIYSEIGNMKLAAGIDLRAEVPGNLSRVTSDESYSNITNFRGIYSVEFPLYAGGSWGRSSLGALMIPGIQLGYSGTELRYENTSLVSRDRVVGTIPDSKSLTMEFGARYGYALTERVQFAASMNVDVLRPFQSDAYSGETRNFPVSFFLGLRRTF